MAEGPITAPEQPLTEEIPCAQCRYNLRTLLPSANCPECNTLIAESIRLHKIAGGIRIKLLAVTAAFLAILPALSLAISWLADRLIPSARPFIGFNYSFWFIQNGASHLVFTAGLFAVIFAFRRVVSGPRSRGLFILTLILAAGFCIPKLVTTAFTILEHWLGIKVDSWVSNIGILIQICFAIGLYAVAWTFLNCVAARTGQTWLRAFALSFLCGITAASIPLAVAVLYVVFAKFPPAYEIVFPLLTVFVDSHFIKHALHLIFWLYVACAALRFRQPAKSPPLVRLFIDPEPGPRQQYRRPLASIAAALLVGLSAMLAFVLGAQFDPLAQALQPFILSPFAVITLLTVGAFLATALASLSKVHSRWPHPIQPALACLLAGGGVLWFWNSPIRPDPPFVHPAAAWNYLPPPFLGYEHGEIVALLFWAVPLLFANLIFWANFARHTQRSWLGTFNVATHILLLYGMLVLACGWEAGRYTHVVFPIGPLVPFFPSRTPWHIILLVLLLTLSTFWTTCLIATLRRSRQNVLNAPNASPTPIAANASDA